MTLARLHADIAARVEAIRAAHPDWLCRRGCDGCCRRLAEMPQLTPAEWALLHQGLNALPPAQLDSIRQALRSLAATPQRPLVCPLLDRTAGACRVYAYRPVACRTYGFYVERDLGLYCRDIEARVASGELAEVVWGNQDRVQRGLRDLGQARALTDWFESAFGQRSGTDGEPALMPADCRCVDERIPCGTREPVPRNLADAP
ncbi:hypothetical protein JCM19379_26030 [Methyloparacoccus murrellii]